MPHLADGYAGFCGGVLADDYYFLGYKGTGNRFLFPAISMATILARRFCAKDSKLIGIEASF